MIKVEDCLPYGHENAVTYDKLKRYTGLDKRSIRREINRLRKEIIILNMQDGKGFFRPIEGEEDALIERFLKQEAHRNKDHRETLIPIRKYFYFTGMY